jgi:hypothetical protein
VSVGIPVEAAFVEPNRILWRNLILLGVVTGAVFIRGLAGQRSLYIEATEGADQRHPAAGHATWRRTGMAYGTGNLAN